MKQIILCFVTLSTVKALAFGYDGSLGGLFKREDPAGPCPNREYAVPYLPEEQIYNRAALLMESQDYCQARVLFRKVMSETLNGEVRTRSWLKVIESTFNQRDYDQLFPEIESFLQEKPISNSTERVHYLAVKAVYEKIEITKGEDNQLVQLALGLFDMENPVEANVKKTYFSFKDFTSKYPQSRYEQEVKHMWKSVRNLVTKRLLKEARLHLIKREYVPALTQFKMLANQGPVLEEFAEVLFSLVRATEEFSWAVLDPKLVKSESLARWSLKNANEITVSLRHQFSEKLQEQALSLRKMMREKLPHDPWTDQLDR